MLKFIDFAPVQLRDSGLFQRAIYEDFEGAVAAAGDWLANHDITLMQIETVVLPNMWDAGEDGTADPHIQTSGEMATEWFQFVRVWYLEAVQDDADDQAIEEGGAE